MKEILNLFRQPLCIVLVSWLKMRVQILTWEWKDAHWAHPDSAYTGTGKVKVSYVLAVKVSRPDSPGDQFSEKLNVLHKRWITACKYVDHVPSYPPMLALPFLALLHIFPFHTKETKSKQRFSMPRLNSLLFTRSMDIGTQEATLSKFLSGELQVILTVNAKGKG